MFSLITSAAGVRRGALSMAVVETIAATAATPIANRLKSRLRMGFSFLAA
jgi:hypothetical protein